MLSLKQGSATVGAHLLRWRANTDHVAPKRTQRWQPVEKPGDERQRVVACERATHPCRLPPLTHRMPKRDLAQVQFDKTEREPQFQHAALIARPMRVQAYVLSTSCTPSTAIPPSPTAAAQRFTEPDRTSPAAKMPGRLVSRGPGKRFMPFQAGAPATAWPVLTKPLSSRSISGGNQLVQGIAPTMEKTAGVSTMLRSCVSVFSSSTASRTFPPIIFRISVWAKISMFSFASTRRER